MRWFDFLFYHFCRTATSAACRFYFPCGIGGLANVPSEGPYIMAVAGHRSYLDIFLVSVLTRRKLRYVGKAGLWKNPIGGWLLTRLGGFPTGGAGDLNSLRTCLDLLSQGAGLVIFPEGTRGSGPQVSPIFDGAAYLALRAGVPIVPVGLWGAEAAMERGAWFPKPRRMFIYTGQPMQPPAPTSRHRIPREAIDALTHQLRVTLQDLFSEARTRVQVSEMRAQRGKMVPIK